MTAEASGRVVGGYRLLRRLGSGGMGTVHEAVDAEGRHVALKVLHPHISADPQARRRLVREVALLHRVRDTGVARVLDAEVEDTEAFVVTELVEGPTLEEDVADDGPFDAGELAVLARGLAEALRAIHAVGVVHRDLKPGNVMMSEHGPVVIDFGIAQVADDARLTQTGMVTGTPGYLDPQVIAGAEPGPACDWWSWAAVLVFAATGRPPFGRGPVDAVLARVTTGQADTRGLPDATAHALLSALAPRPADRLGPDDVLAVLDGGPTRVVAAHHHPPAAAAAPDATVLTAVPPARGFPAETWPGEPGAWATRPGPEAWDPGPAEPATRTLPAAPGPPPASYPPRRPAAEVRRTDVRPPGHVHPPEQVHPPGHLGLPEQGAGPVPDRAPAWAVPPRRRALVVAVSGLGLSAMAPFRPGLFLLAAAAVMVLTATAGWAGRSRRAARLRRGPRGGDDARMLAGLPWHLLRGAAVVLPGTVLGAALGAAAWWAGSALGDPRLTAPVVLWAAALVTLTAAWLTPSSRAAREGARAVVDVLTPTAGFRALLVVVVVLVVAAVAGVVLLAPPTPTWAPLPPPVLGL